MNQWYSSTNRNTNCKLHNSFTPEEIICRYTHHRTLIRSQEPAWISERKHMPTHTDNQNSVFQAAAWSYLLKYHGSIIYLFFCYLFKDAVRLHSVKWLCGGEQGNGKDVLSHNFLGRTEESYEEVRSSRHLGRDPNQGTLKYSSKHYQILK